MRPGDTVTLVLSLGPEPVEVPAFGGLTIRAYASELANAGLRYASPVPDSPAWDVLYVKGVDPGAGTLQKPNTVITITDVSVFP